MEAITIPKNKVFNPENIAENVFSMRTACLLQIHSFQSSNSKTWILKRLFEKDTVSLVVPFQSVAASYGLLSHFCNCVSTESSLSTLSFHQHWKKKNSEKSWWWIPKQTNKPKQNLQYLNKSYMQALVGNANKRRQYSKRSNWNEVAKQYRNKTKVDEETWKDEQLAQTKTQNSKLRSGREWEIEIHRSTSKQTLKSIYWHYKKTAKQTQGQPNAVAMVVSKQQ